MQVITPFYTHLGADGKEQGILVNRGWVPADYKNLKHHYNTASSGKITGVLYKGDPETKYSLPNSPTVSSYINVTPYDLSLLMQLPN